MFVIIYAATVNSHKLFGLVNFLFCLMTKTKGMCTEISIAAAGTYFHTMCAYRCEVRLLQRMPGSKVEISGRFKHLVIKCLKMP